MNRAILAVIILVMVISAGSARGQDISNEYPSIENVSIEEFNSIIYVNVSIKDMNGWEDIYNVTVIIERSSFDVYKIIYNPYEDFNDTTPSISFEEIDYSLLNQFNHQLKLEGLKINSISNYLRTRVVLL